MLTIKDIAKKADVSVATVSKVMNGYDDIGEVTKAKVMKIIKEKPGLNPNAYMGLVMKKFKGKVDGKKAMEVINKILE